MYVLGSGTVKDDCGREVTGGSGMPSAVDEPSCGDDAGCASLVFMYLNVAHQALVENQEKRANLGRWTHGTELGDGQRVQSES